MAETIFSKIIRREIPATIVYEDDEVMAIRDIAPEAPTHVLVIPKTAIATTNDLTAEHDALVGRMIRVAAEIAGQEGIAEDGYRLVMNCNQDGGQSVFHIHLHLLGGRTLGWPPG
jgi:histidine triad (HIT) family protein